MSRSLRCSAFSRSEHVEMFQALERPKCVSDLRRPQTRPVELRQLPGTETARHWPDSAVIDREARSDQEPHDRHSQNDSGDVSAVWEPLLNGFEQLLDWKRRPTFGHRCYFTSMTA